MRRHGILSIVLALFGACGCSIATAQDRFLAANQPTCEVGSPTEAFFLDETDAADCDITGEALVADWVEAHCRCVNGVWEPVGSGSGSGTFDVDEDGASAATAVTKINVVEPDATAVTESPSGTARLNLAAYALLAGRSGGQLLYGGSADGEVLDLYANSATGTNVLWELYEDATHLNDYVGGYAVDWLHASFYLEPYGQYLILNDTGSGDYFRICVNGVSGCPFYFGSDGTFEDPGAFVFQPDGDFVGEGIFEIHGGYIWGLSGGGEANLWVGSDSNVDAPAIRFTNVSDNKAEIFSGGHTTALFDSSGDTHLFGDLYVGGGDVFLESSSVSFEGTPDAYETVLGATDPTHDNSILLPNAGGTLALISDIVTDHGALTGLGDDDHTQYALLAGRSGGQTLNGGTVDNNDLTLIANSVETYPRIVMNDAPGTGSLLGLAVQNSTDYGKLVLNSNGWDLEAGNGDFWSFLNADTSTEVAQIDSSGNAQFDGDATVDGGDLNLGASSSPISMDGATADSFKTVLAPVDPTANHNVNLPNADTTTVQAVASNATPLTGVDGTTGAFTRSADINLATAAGHTVDTHAADSVIVAGASTTLPATCNEGQEYQDTDSGGCERYICVATNQWARYACGEGKAARGFKAYGSGSFSHNSSGNYLAVTSFDTEASDTDGFHSTSSAQGEAVVPAGLDGYYVVNCGGTWDSNATGNRDIALDHTNGAGTVIERGAGQVTVAIASMRMSRTALFFASAGDKFICYAYQSSGGTRSLDTTRANSGTFSATLVTLVGGGIIGDHGTQLVQSGTQSISDATTTAITFETETKDTDDYHAANADSIIIPTGLSGAHAFVCAIEYASNATGERRAVLYKNAAEVLRSSPLPVSGAVTVASVTYLDLVAAQGDDYECRAYQSSGGSLNANATGTVFSAVMVNADEADVKRDNATDLAYYDKDGGGTINTDGSEAPFIPAPRYGFDMRQDFITPGTPDIWTSGTVQNDWFYEKTGTGANCDVAGGSGARPGQTICDTGTTSSGEVTIRTSTVPFTFGGGAMVAEAVVYIDTSLSDGTNRYTVEAGFADFGVALTTTDGCYLRYADDINSGKWQGICYNNAATSTVDTTVTAAANTYYRLTTYVNAAGTLATFCVNGANCVTVNSNIPTAVGRQFGGGVHYIKRLGGTQRNLYLDYIWLHEDLTTAR